MAASHTRASHFIALSFGVSPFLFNVGAIRLPIVAAK